MTNRAKNPAKRRGHQPVRPSAALATVQMLPIRIPPTPDTLGELGAEIWAMVWTAGDGFYVEAVDRHVIQRYCELHDRREALLEVANGELVTIGSQGQDVLHPAIKHVSEVERQLQALEDRLGLNPSDRTRLGLAEATRVSKLEQLRQAQAKRKAR